MFNLTLQERQVLLFLAIVALIGVGINFSVKFNSRMEKFVKLDASFGRLNINKAGCEDLLNIKGIGNKLAQDIIAYRNKYGPFKDLEELKAIKGIGEFRYKRIIDYLDIR